MTPSTTSGSGRYSVQATVERRLVMTGVEGSVTTLLRAHPVGGGAWPRTVQLGALAAIAGLRRSAGRGRRCWVAVAYIHRRVPVIISILPGNADVAPVEPVPLGAFSEKNGFVPFGFVVVIADPHLHSLLDFKSLIS